MTKKSIIALVAACAAIGAAVAAVIIFRDEISDFIKSIIAKLESLRSRDYYDDFCYDDFDDFDDFSDFEDVESPF